VTVALSEEEQDRLREELKQKEEIRRQQVHQSQQAKANMPANEANKKPTLRPPALKK
jgi:hypothetical protein